MHLQGKGEPETGNRPYGLSVDIRVPDNIREWLKSQQDEPKSESTGERYCTLNDTSGGAPKDYLQTELFHDGSDLYLLVHGTNLNHPEGALIQLDPNAITVSELYKFSSDNDIITTCGFPNEGEYPFADVQGLDAVVSGEEEEEE